MSKWMQHTIELIAVCLVLIGIAVFYNTYQAIPNSSGSHPSNHVHHTAVDYAARRTVPTLYFHGLQGSFRSTNHLIAVGSQTDGHRAMTIDVDRNGRVTYHGSLNRGIRYPLVQVNFLDNTAPVAKQTLWIHSILAGLWSRYRCTRYNAVAHSAGAVAVLAATDRFGHQGDVAKLQKFVSIGGPYDGVIGMNDRPNDNRLLPGGRPRLEKAANHWYPSYRELLRASRAFPRNVRVLNVYGSLSPKLNSDGYVATTSARSLKYLIGRRVKSYQAIRIRGHYAQHSLLHDNSVVDRVVDRFIFNE